jgi:hypothetical protein
LRFVGDLHDFEFSPEGDDSIITRSVIVFIDGVGRWWIVPRGFLCDGGSVPRLLWFVVGHPTENESIRAYVLHDRYYARPNGRTKAQIDRMFYEALIADGVGRIEAQAKYRAVQWFGGFAWRNHRRREEQQ